MLFVVPGGRGVERCRLGAVSAVVLCWGAVEVGRTFPAAPCGRSKLPFSIEKNALLGLLFIVEIDYSIRSSLVIYTQHIW